MDKLEKVLSSEPFQKDSEEFRAKIIAYKWDFWKFFLGTFVLGVAGVACTWVFKRYELKIANRKAESEYLQPYLLQYLTLLDKDTVRKYEKAYNMAEFITYTLTDDELKIGWDRLGKILLLRRDSVTLILAIEIKKQDLLNTAKLINDIARTVIKDTSKTKRNSEKIDLEFSESKKRQMN